MKQKILYLCAFLFISLSSYAVLSLKGEGQQWFPYFSKAEDVPENRIRTLQINQSETVPIPFVQSDNDPIVIDIRDGFPYCESFTESSTRANTVIEGDAYLTVDNNEDPNGDGVLRLTRNTNNQNGYVYVDIPFPSRFGLKVSFEYFSYGSSNPVRADGLSFFMFDGALGQVAPNFEIGGYGGALGYTPLKGGGVNFPGIKGGYLGIGFDELGNFGNSAFGKYGSFLDPDEYTTSGANGKFYPHSVVIRGPVDGTDEPFYTRDRNNALVGVNRYKSYGFVDGKILNNYPTDNGLGFLYAGPPWFFAQDLDVYQNLDERFFLNDKYPRFTIDAFSSTSPESCLDEGYRKVFIDLNPDESSLDATGRPTKFDIQIFMLVNLGDGFGPRIIQIFDTPVEYNFKAPNLLKVGFAGATGNNVNFHDIRNVRVEVSDEEALRKPETEPLEAEVCEGEENEFILDVELLNDADNAFIRCVQLYETEQEALDAATNASATSIFPSDDSGDPNNYCPFGTCQDFLCRPENLSKNVEEGTFEVFLVSENGIETPKVKFTGNPGFSGEVTVYYTIVDNFGQVSLPKPITITINPLPIPTIETIDPLIWEDFEENDILVRFDVEPKETGFQYQWFKDGNEIPGATQDFYVAEGATAPGSYTVEIETDKGCINTSQEAIEIRLVRNIEPDLISIREDCIEEGIVRVILDPSNVLGDEKWRIVDSNGDQVYPATDWTPIPAGAPEIIQGNLLAGDYRFQIGDEFREGQPGSDGTPLFRHDIPFTILPIEFPLQILSTSSVDELCFEEGGSIQIQVQDGSGNYTYELIQDGSVMFTSPTNIQDTNYEFTQVPVGTYEIRVASGPRCEEFGQETISGPEPIILNISAQKNVTCSPDDASVDWLVTGGTAPYNIISLSKDGTSVDINTIGFTQNGDVFSFTGLEEGEYVLLVTDSRACETFQSEPAVISTIPKPEISISVDPEFCENVPLISIIPELTNTGLMTSPEYAWIIPSGERLTSSATIAGVDYTLIDHDNNNLTPPHLTVSGLNEGDFNFILELRGEDSCDQDFDVQFSVNPQPELEVIREEGAKCFGEVGGLVEINVTNGDNNDFEFRIQGLTDWEVGKFIFDEGISSGTYTIEVRNITTLCSSEIEVTVPEVVEELIVQEDMLVEPSCNEDNGSFSFLVDGGTLVNNGYRFVLNGTEITEQDDNFETLGTNDYRLIHLAPGNYELEVFDENDCFKTVNFTLTAQEVPEFSLVDIAICEGEMAVLEVETVVLAGAIPEYVWKVEDQSAPGNFILIENNTTINGANHAINGNRLEITGLNHSVAPYTYSAEVIGQGVCPGPEMFATVKVFDIPEAEFAITDVSCNAGSDGTIILENELDGNFTFTIIETGEVKNDGNFSNLVAGTYTIQIQEDGAPCPVEVVVTIDQPNPLTLDPVDSENPTCGENNGEIIFQINGGTLDFAVLVNNSPIEDYDFQINGNTYSIQNLAPGAYSVAIEDGNGCAIPNTVIFNLNNDDGFPIDSEPLSVQLCEGESAVLSPDLTIPPGASPELRWYKDSSLSQQILTGTSDGEVSYEITDEGILTITGLDVGDYEYYLRISGPQICGQVTLASVNVLQEITFDIEPQAITCFGDEDGSITVSNIQGGTGIYELSLNGIDWQDDLVFDGLPVGNYTVYVRDNSQSDSCEESQSDILIEGPDEEIQINTPDIIRTSCGLSNGSVQNLEVSGDMETIPSNGEKTILLLVNCLMDN
ncbi:lectin-like domain-containing protein [Algoriphagus hitonicola]|uniref:lectin-like domain-containing protein n=1 Tax=Algoriphagus hitonicola TaxID=435880 RepID=UPI0036237888